MAGLWAELVVREVWGGDEISSQYLGKKCCLV